MHKLCPCGETMDLQLRTVIYSTKLEIDNVPIFSCDACQHSEVNLTVKSELKEIISAVDVEVKRKCVSFSDLNEWANLLVTFNQINQKKQTSFSTYETMLYEHIDDLLDLLIYTEKINDVEWGHSIVKKLEQLSSNLST